MDPCNLTASPRFLQMLVGVVWPSMCGDCRIPPPMYLSPPFPKVLSAQGGKKPERHTELDRYTVTAAAAVTRAKNVEMCVRVCVRERREERERREREREKGGPILAFFSPPQKQQQQHQLCMFSAGGLFKTINHAHTPTQGQCVFCNRLLLSLSLLALLVLPPPPPAFIHREKIPLIRRF